jgi:hypothetical protein
MISRILSVAVMSTMIGFAVGITHSSFRHYYRKFAEEEDLLSSEVIEVSVVENKTKKSRRKN